MNKKLVIGILAIVLVVGSLWGLMGNGSDKGIKQELETAIAQLAQTETEAAKLQKTVQMSEEQLAKAQNDLVELRKANKAFEAKISKGDAVVAALTQERVNLVGQINKMKNSPAVATSNNQHQLVAVKEISAETGENAKKQHSRMWIKSEVGPAEPGALSREELQAKLAKAESSVHELQEKFITAETAVQKQKQQLVAVNEELEETRAKVKGDYSSRVWIKSEVTPVEQEAREKKELQAELARIESSVQELQEKLAVAEQGAQRAKELQEKLAQSESSIQELQEKFAVAEQGPQREQESQEKSARIESSVQKLQEKLTVAEQGVQSANELQEKLAQSESSIQELQGKFAQAESTIQELEGKLEESASSIRDLSGKVTALNQTRITHEYESVRAQVIGLELIIEEKDAAIEDVNKKLGHWQVNKDLLLSKITEQQEQVQKLQAQNSGLLRDLAAKKKELADAKN